METFLPALLRFWRSFVRYQVPRYSGWKRTWSPCFQAADAASDTKYRVIADGNFTGDWAARVIAGTSDTKYRVIADGNVDSGYYQRTDSSGQIPSTAL